MRIREREGLFEQCRKSESTLYERTYIGSPLSASISIDLIYTLTCR